MGRAPAGGAGQEAARRGPGLEDLFLEMWQLYETKGRGAREG